LPRLLPWRSHLRLSLLAHVHLHMRSQARYRGAGAATPRRAISPAQLRALVRHLKTAIRGLAWRPPATEWADYYAETNYTADALRDKQRLVGACLDRVAPRTVWDLGGNNSRSLALLLIKRPGAAREPLRTDERPVSLVDLPQTLYELHAWPVRSPGGARSSRPISRRRATTISSSTCRAGSSGPGASRTGIS
jgi:hypothetical protein